MPCTNKMMLMLAYFLYGDRNAEEFSFDFPAKLASVYADLEAENPELAVLLNEEMPETCSWFDPYNTGDEGTMNELQFREKVAEVYQRAVPLAARKVS